MGTMKLLTLLLVVSGICTGDESLHNLFYKPFDDARIPCFRLTNATDQIGCSASDSHTRGVLYYMDELNDITRLQQAPHPPYIVLMEPEFFRGNGSIVRNLSGEPAVKGIIVRYDVNFTMTPESASSFFSPERRCPNKGFGEEPDSCGQDNYWNNMGNSLLYNDFGDFPIFVLESNDFDDALECYNDYNNRTSGGYGDFPLCSVELVADMAVAVDTPTCFRRGKLPIPYLYGRAYCAPLGDRSVWGSLFNLSQSDGQIIMLAAKLDSVSFFPYSFSYGASSEVAAIATLLAILQQLGQLKRNGSVLSLSKPILYSFFHGESWDYIGSSRMAYDMSHDKAFPENEALPRVSLANISHFLELGQLGLLSHKTIYVHGDKGSEFVQALENVSGSVLVRNSSREDLPPASLQRFIREGVKTRNEDFSGSLLTSFDETFDNKFYGSRYDDVNNFGNKSLKEVASDLADIATAVTKAVFRISGPNCRNSCESVEEGIIADPDLISDVLTCFLVDSSCDRFKSVFISSIANNSLPSTPLPRYVSANTASSLEALIIKQLISYLTANDADELSTPVKCSECLDRMTNDSRDMTVNITWVQYSSGATADEDMCLCLESFTYTHQATSPVFAYGLGYDNTDYSTWAESSWNTISVRLYLVTYYQQEVGFLFVGLFFTVVTLLISIQCTRKGNEIFQTSQIYNVVTT